MWINGNLRRKYGNYLVKSNMDIFDVSATPLLKKLAYVPQKIHAYEYI